MKSFSIGGSQVGEGELPLFLPDIGTFFNQDMALAKKMVEQLSIAGSRVIKGEILHSPEICLKQAGTVSFLGSGPNEILHEDYRSLIERKVVSLDMYAELFGYCADKGLDVVVSVYDRDGVDFAISIGVAALKVASSNITHQPLIECIAASGLPVIVDTGHASVEEIARAVNWAQDAGAMELIVQHSPLAPPSPINLHNLRFMNSLGQAFGLPYGLSDHHGSEEMLYAAVAMGASILEKGVCPDELQDEQDVAHALPIGRVAEVICKIQNIHSALGDGVRQLERDREKYKPRMGLVSKRSLKSGDAISLESVAFAFPTKGIAVEHWSEVKGWKINRPIDEGEVIRWQDVYAAD